MEIKKLNTETIWDTTYKADFTGTKKKVIVRTYAGQGSRFTSKTYVGPTYEIAKIEIDGKEYVGGLYINDEFIGIVTGYYPCRKQMEDHDWNIITCVHTYLTSKTYLHL